jgi:hypothetical protein
VLCGWLQLELHDWPALRALVAPMLFVPDAPHQSGAIDVDRPDEWCGGVCEW